MTGPVAVREAAALLRLREMREDAARVSMERCREREAASRRVVELRLAQIAHVRQSRRRMVEWLSGRDTDDVPRTWPYAAARLSALDDELERAEVELIDEREDLKAAVQELEAARAAWLRESARRQAVGQLAAEARLDMAREREQRAERETEPRRLPDAWQGA